jgi:hypothetical protein
LETTNIKYIVKPVTNVSVFSTMNRTFRQPKFQEYVKANQRWWVELRFNSEIDLALLEKAVATSPVRLIEFQGSYYIEDPVIPDQADMSQAFRYEVEGLPRLNAAVSVVCPEFIPARFVCVVKLLEDGHGESVVSVDLVVHGTNQLEAVDRFLNGSQSDFGRVRDLMSRDSDVNEALLYFGADANPWANLYKACEVVQDRFGSQIVTQGWCSRTNWERFNRTANHQEVIGAFSRHARSKVAPPANPMTLNEARSVVRDLLHGWIQHLLNNHE